MTPEEAARARIAAIEALQAELAGHVTDLQRSLYEGLLSQLQETYDNPDLLPGLLAEFTQQVHLPLIAFYGQQLMTLPTLTIDYAAAVGLTTDYVALRAPLDSWLRGRFGLSAAGDVLSGGQLSLLLTDTQAARQLAAYAYTAQTQGVGLNAYRQGLSDLIQGVQTPGAQTQGVYQRLYKEAYDAFNQADRVLQTIVAEKLDLKAYLYQGGLIASSRAFCKVRNGKVFLAEEIKKFGTSKDTYGGYTNKAEGLFAGKSEPYEPFSDCGGYNCRHGLNAVPNAVALRLRPDLEENEKGELVAKK